MRTRQRVRINRRIRPDKNTGNRNELDRLLVYMRDAKENVNATAVLILLNNEHHWAKFITRFIKSGHKAGFIKVFTGLVCPLLQI